VAFHPSVLKRCKEYGAVAAVRQAHVAFAGDDTDKN
jgi:hypothetical protein